MRRAVDNECSAVQCSADLQSSVESFVCEIVIFDLSAFSMHALMQRCDMLRYAVLYNLMLFCLCCMQAYFSSRRMDGTRVLQIL